MAIFNVSMLKIQAMNPSIGYTIIHVDYQITRSQSITPIVPSKTNMLPTSTYPMWYNVIPPFMLLDLNLYSIYQIRTKGLNPLNFRNYIGYCRNPSLGPRPRQGGCKVAGL
jgi:hypothetical protein